MNRLTSRIAVLFLLSTCLLLAGCSSNVGVGLSVGVPIGNHGYMGLGTNRWF